MDDAARATFRKGLAQHAGAAYEEGNRRTFLASMGKRGLRIVLRDGSVFWSRGWFGCDRCHGAADHPRRPQAFEERVNGEVTTGWRCSA